MGGFISAHCTVLLCKKNVKIKRSDIENNQIRVYGIWRKNIKKFQIGLPIELEHYRLIERKILD